VRKQVFIVGFGLIGGSLALALGSRTAHKVYGYDTDESTVLLAKRAHAAQRFGLDDLAHADIVLLALRPQACLDFLREHKDYLREGALVIDVCGVKRQICAEAPQILEGTGVCFIGGHPMAGREVSGFANATATLFDGSDMILTPGKDTPPALVIEAESFFLSLGFRAVTITSPWRHDEFIAFTSQLAHIVSSSYMQNPMATGSKGFCSGSFADLTRVAKLDVDMWTELFLANQDNLVAQIDVIVENLTEFRRYIAEDDAESLRTKLQLGRLGKEECEKSEKT
jgi:prephenate dehydrogenase